MTNQPHKKALIIGCNGQDGRLLSKLLYRKGYTVYGVYRGTVYKPIDNVYCFTRYELNLPNEYSEFVDLLNDIRPDEIYNFAGESNVFDAYKNPNVTFRLNYEIPERILSAIVECNLIQHTKYFQASSSLVFGRSDLAGAKHERSHRSPIYPYGISKNAADDMINDYRNHYGIFACSGIFFNHESPYRGDNFFTKRIAKQVAEIAVAKSKKPIKISPTHSFRDFGYAPDFVKAAWMMLQQSAPKDYVIGTGVSTNLADFTRYCLESVKLNDFFIIDPEMGFNRKDEPINMTADYTAIKRDLGWQPTKHAREIAAIMTRYEILKMS